MDTRANYAIIGIFALAVIAAGFGFVFWFSGTDSGKKRTFYKVEFAGSVAGLSKGAPVLFNGIRVGDVTDVYFEASKPQQAFARIEVQPDTPVKSDTRAALDVALLSGSAVIALTGGNPASPPLEKRPGDDLPTIMAERGGLGSIIETARGTAERANLLLESLTGIVAANKDSIGNTLHNVEAFSEALGRNAPQLDNLLRSVGQAADRIGPVAAKLETLTDDADALLRSVDRSRISRIVENVDGVLQTVGENRNRIGDIMTDTSTLVRRLNDAAPKLDQALADLGRTLGAVDPVKLSRVVDNADRFTGALANSSRDVEATLRNANSLTAKLNQSADRIDGVLKAAEGFLGSAAGEEGKSTFASIRGAADSIRKLAENLDKRTAEITTGLTRFTGTGSRQVEAIGTDARRTVNDVGRAARTLERNPQSLIFGGRPSLPEYTGR